MALQELRGIEQWLCQDLNKRLSKWFAARLDARWIIRNNMTEDDYKQALQTQDWSYEYSDDMTVWRRGLESMALLRRSQLIHDPEASLWNAVCPSDFKLRKPV